MAGQYSGQLTDNPKLCAKLYSDCNKLDIMFFMVTPCDNLTDIIEEREYQCLGHWEENGQLLAYVKRKNAVSERFECFVGATDVEGQIFLSESGFNCQRNLRTQHLGMRLIKERKCLKNVLNYILIKVGSF